MEKKEFPSIYAHTEKEAKKIGFDLVSRNIQPITTQDAQTCPHKFVLEGMFSVKCTLCGFGLVTSGVKESQDLMERLTKKQA